MNLSIKDLLEVSHQQAHRLLKLAENEKFTSVSSDSRTVGKGDLFVALRGETFDGHQFLKSAKQKGAKAAIVDAKWYKRNARTTLPCIVVTDTRNAFGELARIYRKKFSIP